jgi:hypothetical protein
MPKTAGSVGASQLSSDRHRLSCEEYSATVAAFLQAQLDKKRALTTKPTMLAIPNDAARVLFKAAQKQKTTRKGVLLSILSPDFLEDMRAYDRSVTTGLIADIVAELHAHPRNQVKNGYHYYTVKLPLVRHQKLRSVALFHRSSMSRLISVAVQMVGPYLINHPCDQLRLFDAHDH